MIHYEQLGNCHFLSHRAVALGLDAEDINAIEDFTEELKAKKTQYTSSSLLKKAEKDELKIRVTVLNILS